MCLPSARRTTPHQKFLNRIEVISLQRRVLDVFVAEVGLQGAGVMTLFGQSVTTGVPRYVRIPSARSLPYCGRDESVCFRYASGKQPPTHEYFKLQIYDMYIQ